jgi:hypothetical protein
MTAPAGIVNGNALALCILVAIGDAGTLLMKELRDFQLPFLACKQEWCAPIQSEDREECLSSPSVEILNRLEITFSNSSEKLDSGVSTANRRESHLNVDKSNVRNESFREGDWIPNA